MVAGGSIVLNLDTLWSPSVVFDMAPHVDSRMSARLVKVVKWNPIESLTASSKWPQVCWLCNVMLEVGSWSLGHLLHSSCLMGETPE